MLESNLAFGTTLVMGGWGGSLGESHHLVIVKNIYRAGQVWWMDSDFSPVQFRLTPQTRGNRMLALTV